MEIFLFASLAVNIWLTVKWVREVNRTEIAEATVAAFKKEYAGLYEDAQLFQSLIEISQERESQRLEPQSDSKH
jgi:hypothetical protein